MLGANYICSIKSDMYRVHRVHRVQGIGYSLRGVQDGNCEIKMEILLIMIVDIIELLFFCRLLFKEII